jgi:tetratricopeptide (TPR) repeat protein
MIENDPSDSFVRYALAKEYEVLNDKVNALHHYLILRSHDPEYVGLYYHLAKLYESLEAFDVAIQVYSDGMRIAKKLLDNHALAELSSAKMNLEMEL